MAGRDPSGRGWLYAKPFDPAPGNPAFYYEHYQVLNLLCVMDLPHRGHVLEVGCGPGWISEMLVLLGFGVTGIDPSADMLEIARQRVAGGVRHRQVAEPGAAEFIQCSIEENSLPSEHFDAVLYHEALHHVVDERRALAETFRALKPGGVVGVCEWAWAPGEEKLETELRAEMAEFGTLESPFTREYLDHLLAAVGFVDVRRYHGINGLFPEDQGGVALSDLAEAPATSTNNLTARKP